MLDELGSGKGLDELGSGKGVGRSTTWRSLAGWIACLALLVAADSSSGAELDRRLRIGVGDVQLTDVIEVQVLDREVIAYDVEGSGRRALRLRRFEDVTWSGSKGRIGVVLTTRRALAITPGAAAWTSIDFQLGERLPDSADLGERLALVHTDRRLLGFDVGTRAWSIESISPREQSIASEVGEGTAVVVTSRRVLGIGAAGAAGFFAAPLRIHEKIEGLSARPNLATVTTSQRVLVFRSPSGSWTFTTRPLR